MRKTLTARWLAGLLCCISTLGATAQEASRWQIDDDWAQVPGGDWNGSTSWVTADGRGLVYVLVRTPPYVRVFNRDGSFVRSWGGDIQIGSAHAITIDDQDNAWISDSARHVIRKFDKNGKLLMTLGVPDEAGDNDSRDKFNQPNHVFIADNGDIWVSDGYGNARVVQFSADGKYIRHIGGIKGDGPGEMNEVHGVALDSRGRILANDSLNLRVNIYAPDGSFVESWPYPSRGGIEVRDGDIVTISDINDDVIHIVKDGRLLDTIHAPRAHGLGVDSDGSLYASGASRMTVLKLTRLTEGEPADSL